MADNTRYGNPAEFDIDLHSIYAAYLGDFDSQNIDWWDASWGNYFRSFNDFLGFGWEAMVVVDSVSGRAHIGARREQIALFARMIKTRFGETLDKEPPSLLPLSPAPARSRTLHRIVNITELGAYKKLSGTLAPAELSHLRARVRAGEPGVIAALFNAGSADDTSAAAAGVRTNGQGYSFAAVRTTWWEKGGPPQGYVPGHGRTVMARPGQGGKGLMLEVGVAALRCANLRAVDVWPPVPDKNYRKAHYVVEEWVDKRTNVERPNFPRAYGFGRSQFVSEKSVDRIVDATLGGLASHDVDGGPNTLILLSIGEPQPIPLPANTTFPPNILQLDVLQLEFALLQQAQRQGVPGVGDRHHPLQSLRQLLLHLQIPVAQHAPLGNAGNEAFYTVLAFQKLLMRETRLPDQLFAPQAFAQPAYGHQPTDFFMGSPGSPFVPSPYQPYGNLPMPPPIGRESRRGSNSSINRMTLPPIDLEPPVLPNPLTRQGTGDSGIGASNKKATGMSVSMSQQDMRSSAREDISPSTRSGSRGPLPRSQTVYWDDAEYSSGSAGERSTSRPRANGKPSAPPPSSLRHSQVINSSGPLASSRSVSFHEAGRPPTIHSQGSSSGKESVTASRSNSGTALGPSGLSMSNGNGNANGNGNVAANGTRSSGSGSASSGDSGKLDTDAKPKVRKQKSSHSVKHLSSALSKFWVD